MRLFYRDKLVDIAEFDSEEERWCLAVAKWTLLSNKGRPNDSKGPDYFIITSPVISATRIVKRCPPYRHQLQYETIDKGYYKTDLRVIERAR